LRSLTELPTLDDLGQLVDIVTQGAQAAGEPARRIPMNPLQLRLCLAKRQKRAARF